MLLGFRTTNTLGFRLPLNLLSSRLHFNLKITSSSSSSNNDDGDDDFRPWLQSKSGSQISSYLTIGNSIHGRSLFASGSIRAGDCILKIPFSVHLTSDSLLPEINSLLSDQVGRVARLAIVILIEQRKGRDSEWYPYISRLPRAGELHSTIFWSKEELDMIRQSSVYQETVEQKAQLEKEYSALRPVLNQFPNIFKDVIYEDFLHAFALVASRAWGSYKAVSMIPFADFLNHDGVSEAMLLSDEDTQFSEVIADQDYAPGKQVLVRYGKFPNSTLLLDFGFTLSYNIYDQVQIQMNIHEHDPLCQMKLELLHKYSPPVVGKNACSFDLLQSSFVIKEVRSSRGKGKGISQALRACARVLCAETFQELKGLELEAIQTDNRLARRPLKNTGKEIESHLLVLSKITRLIQDLDASFKSLTLEEAHCISGNFALRKRMAQDLLSGELRVLKSASAWLNNYCATLAKETTAVHKKPSSFENTST